MNPPRIERIECIDQTLSASEHFAAGDTDWRLALAVLFARLYTSSWYLERVFYSRQPNGWEISLLMPGTVNQTTTPAGTLNLLIGM